MKGSKTVAWKKTEYVRNNLVVKSSDREGEDLCFKWFCCLHNCAIFCVKNPYVGISDVKIKIFTLRNFSRMMIKCTSSDTVFQFLSNFGRLSIRFYGISCKTICKTISHEKQRALSRILLLSLLFSAYFFILTIATVVASQVDTAIKTMSKNEWNTALENMQTLLGVRNPIISQLRHRRFAFGKRLAIFWRCK